MREVAVKTSVKVPFGHFSGTNEEYHVKPGGSRSGPAVESVVICGAWLLKTKAEWVPRPPSRGKATGA